MKKLAFTFWGCSGHEFEFRFLLVVLCVPAKSLTQKTTFAENIKKETYIYLAGLLS